MDLHLHEDHNITLREGAHALVQGAIIALAAGAEVTVVGEDFLVLDLLIGIEGGGRGDRSLLTDREGTVVADLGLLGIAEMGRGIDLKRDNCREIA
mmetsp:Transcript_10461/g.15670  ORF Transcript_10461/g.15670 Transcript_10461/m.15670 type:complete len:96 (-) Transcript_10461:1763-2050(-)